MRYAFSAWRQASCKVFDWRLAEKQAPLLHPGLERSSFLGGSDGSDDPDDGKDVINPSFSIRGLPTVAMLRAMLGWLKHITTLHVRQRTTEPSNPAQPSANNRTIKSGTTVGARPVSLYLCKLNFDAGCLHWRAFGHFSKITPQSHWDKSWQVVADQM